MAKKITHPMKAKKGEPVCPVEGCGLNIWHVDAGVAHIDVHTNEIVVEPDAPPRRSPPVKPADFR